MRIKIGGLFTGVGFAPPKIMVFVWLLLGALAWGDRMATDALAEASSAHQAMGETSSILLYNDKALLIQTSSDSTRPVPYRLPGPVRLPPLQRPQREEDHSTCAGSQGTARDVCLLVNKERTAAGLGELKIDPRLNEVAMRYAKEMYSTGRFSHYNDRGGPDVRVRDAGIHYWMVGENIAMGQRNAREVVRDWMNSPGHRRNIMNGNFTKHGIAHYPPYWVHVFLR